MYLEEILLENVGPLEFADLSLPFDENGNPKPVVLVGRNGSGKSILLSHIVDALIEFAKNATTISFTLRDSARFYVSIVPRG
jgi:predicted ATP-binding protein involved in virulence